jgi:hypothetical protein
MAEKKGAETGKKSFSDHPIASVEARPFRGGENAAPFSFVFPICFIGRSSWFFAKEPKPDGF